jgi:hypothetical protein
MTPRARPDIRHLRNQFLIGRRIRQLRVRAFPKSRVPFSNSEAGRGAQQSVSATLHGKGLPIGAGDALENRLRLMESWAVYCNRIPISFRETIAAFGRDNCVCLAAIQAWAQNLGHESLTTTYGNYGKVASNEQGQARQKCGPAIIPDRVSVARGKVEGKPSEEKTVRRGWAVLIAIGIFMRRTGPIPSQD